MMKIAYITAQAPYGQGETFIIGEMLAIKEAKEDLLIIPRSPTKKVFHQEANNLLPNTIWLPLINIKIFYIFLISLFTKPRLWKILLSVMHNSRTSKILVKNLIVIPKGVFIANFMPEKRVNHIHAHWGGTTATMAWVVSKLTDIPWSITLHRWDIKESNMLREKIKSAKYSRCISENGKNELLKIIGTDFKTKIKVIHMGVKITINADKADNNEKKYFRIITPANLLAVKGHKYLIEACSILVKEGMKNFECIFYGKGLMRSELKGLIKKKLLNNYIKIEEMIPHEKLMGIYKNKKADILILPSINTKNGEHEGIPVALMEAMAYSIPVISTNTGGIPELLSDQAGVIVEERNSQQLALAIKKFIKNKNFREKIGRQGYERVCKEFNTQKNTKKLVDIFKYYS